MRRFMARDAKKIFTAHWEEAKRRFGPWNAGLTLKSFIEKNTQVSTPEDCGGKHRSRAREGNRP